MALVRAWPKCKEPVTFGGGMTMVNWPVGLGSEMEERWKGEKSRGLMMQFVGIGGDLMTHSVLGFEEALLLPPTVPSSFHILGTVCVRDITR